MSTHRTQARPRGGPTTVGVVSGVRRWFEPALLVVTVGLLVAGGAAWVAEIERVGQHAVGCGDPRRDRPGCGLGGGGAVAANAGR